MILLKEAMSVLGRTHEQIGHMHLDELRREAFVGAQVRRARGRVGSRIAATLRAWAERLEAPTGMMTGPWREDFRQRAARRV
jgi:hypothetical protein